MRHILNAYIDGHKKIVFCVICGQEEGPGFSLEQRDCPGQYIPVERRYECGEVKKNLDT